MSGVDPPSPRRSLLIFLFYFGLYPRDAYKKLHQTYPNKLKALTAATHLHFYTSIHSFVCIDIFSLIHPPDIQSHFTTAEMKTSIVIAATSAVLAAASPVEKRVFVTEVQTLYEVVTVTEGDVPLPTAPAGIKVRPQSPEPTVIVVTETFNPSEPTESPEPQPEVSVITIVETESPAPPEASESPTPEPSQSPEPEPEAPTLSLPSAIDVPQPTAPADNDFIGSAIYHHNVHRANHSSPALTWDTKIARYAANSAATCVFEHDMYVNTHTFLGHVN